MAATNIPVPGGDGDGRCPNLVGIEAVADRLGVEARHVRRLVHERRIPYVKWGHLIRFDPAEVEEWLDRARRPQAGDSDGTGRAS